MYSINKKINERLYFIDHQGSDVLYCDFSKSGENEMIELVEIAFEKAKKAGPSVSVLSNFRSTPRSPNFVKKMREGGKWFNQNNVQVKIGVVGVDNSLTKVIMSVTMTITRVRNMKLFESEEAALNWLSS